MRPAGRITEERIVKEGIQLNQIELISAISDELIRQVPGLTAQPRLFNAVIAAANSIVEEFAKPIVKAAPAMGLKAWLDSDDVGASSEYMAWALSDYDQQVLFWGRNSPHLAYPHDPDDLGRCIRLIEAVPEFGGKIPEMAHRGKEWLAVATNWADWVEMYNADDDGLYDAMQAAYGE